MLNLKKIGQLAINATERFSFGNNLTTGIGKSADKGVKKTSNDNSEKKTYNDYSDSRITYRNDP